MARTPKSSGRLNRGPWDAKRIRAALEADGWSVIKPGPHTQMTHPDRSGTITVDTKWTGIKPGHDGFRSICTIGGYSKKELIELINAVS